MIVLTASKSCLTASRRELLVEGAVNVSIVQFVFSPDWDGLTKTAVFQAGDDKYSVLLDESNETPIPWEVLQNPRRTLYAGVYGTDDESLVLPTIWASLGVIQEGASPGQETQPPTPTVYEQILSIATNAQEIAQSVRDDADAGKFDGAPGPEGPPGAAGVGVPAITPEDEGKMLGVLNGISQWVLGGSGSGNLSSPDVSTIRVLDKTEFDSLPIKSPTTLYFVKG